MVYAGGNADSQTTLVNPDLIDGWGSKSLIVHEFAHQLQHWANYPGSGSIASFFADVDYTLEDTSVFTPTAPNDHTHYLNSKEHQSAAIVEGMANWVVAVAFNNINQGDCGMAPVTGVDWLWEEEGLDDRAFSCQGYTIPTNDDEDDAGIEYTVYGVDGLDYFEDYCNTDVTEDVATELDWLRFLWDLNAGEGVPFADIFDAFDAAAPEDWDISVNAQPAFEYAIETGLGYGTEYAAQEHRNGVQR